MATKLLLIEDVEHLGRSGDIVSVKHGYARNKLIPSGAARLASAHSLRLQAKLKETRLQQAITDKAEAQQFAERINGQTITTTVKVDPAGHMYGSVSSSDVVNLLQEQHGIAIERRSVQLTHPIKEIGVTDIILKLKEGVSATFHLKVIAEGSEEKTAEPMPEPKESQED